MKQIIDLFLNWRCLTISALFALAAILVFCESEDLGLFLATKIAAGACALSGALLLAFWGNRNLIPEIMKLLEEE